MAGVINPRKLIKAQHKISVSKYGCEMIDGQVDKITRIEKNVNDIDDMGSLFKLDILRYKTIGPSSTTSGLGQWAQVLAKKVILANGVYTNIIPKYQVKLQRSYYIYICIKISKPENR